MSPLIPNIPSRKVEEALTVVAEALPVNLAIRQKSNHARVSRVLATRVDLDPRVKVAVNRPKMVMAAVQNLLTDVNQNALDGNRPTPLNPDVIYGQTRALAVIQSGLFFMS